MRKRLNRTAFRQANKSKHLSYCSLEPRQLLAVITTFDAASRSLDIAMTEDHDVVVIDNLNGSVTINGSLDTDSTLNGIQEQAVATIGSINVTGDSTRIQQNVAFAGDFSSPASTLVNIGVFSVNNVSMLGDYFIGNSFQVTLAQSGGGVGDGDTGSLFVGGKTIINAGENRIHLDNATHDFLGNLFVTTGGVGNSVALADINDLNFENATVTGNLWVRAAGHLSDTVSASMNVAGNVRLHAHSVTLGESTTNTTNFGGVSFHTTGAVEFHEDSDTFFSGSTLVQSLLVNSDGMIEDGMKSHINVAQQATFVGDAGIELGDRRFDLFNTGQLLFQSNGDVAITENSSIQVVGDNFGSALALTASGDIEDDSLAAINIAGQATLIANNVEIGDSATDQFNADAISFQASEAFLLTEDSNLHIFGNDNSADRLRLVANGAITDDTEASVNVTQMARFRADTVVVGDSPDDQFNAGSVSFETTGAFSLAENSDLNISQASSAETANLRSQGRLSNAAGAEILVNQEAILFGQQVELGFQPGDAIHFGSLSFNAPGSVFVFEDSSTLLTGASEAGALVLASTDSIADGSLSELDVAGIATFKAPSMVLGDTETDQVVAFGLNVESPGDVSIQLDDHIVLASNVVAENLELTVDGRITNGEETVVAIVDTMRLDADLVNLGNNVADSVNINRLNFNAAGNVNIEAQSSINLVGSSTAFDLELNSTGNISDDDLAQTIVQNAVTLSGVDIVLGDSGFDCFDADAGLLFVNASGIQDITTGC